VRLCLACALEFGGGTWTCPRCGNAPRLSGERPVFAPELDAGRGDDADYLYDDLAAAEERHFWFRARRRLILRAIRRHFAGAERLLEIGCGTGFVLAGLRRAFPTLSLAGSDARTAGLAHAAARLPGTALFQMDARRIPFRNEFDVIGAFDVLEHITEDEEVLAEMGKALRPRGGIVLTVPQHAWLWSAVDDFSHHKRRYARRDIVGKLRRAGFEPLWATSFCSLLLPLLLASRLRKPKSVAELDPASELRIGAAANGAFEAVSRLEAALIAAGLRFPWGGSLLVVAARATAPT
jgi:SAM-dependent methyltransferase